MIRSYRILIYHQRKRMKREVGGSFVCFFGLKPGLTTWRGNLARCPTVKAIPTRAGSKTKQKLSFNGQKLKIYIDFLNYLI
jgi:hypothetical protein